LTKPAGGGDDKPSWRPRAARRRLNREGGRCDSQSGRPRPRATQTEMFRASSKKSSSRNVSASIRSGSLSIICSGRRRSPRPILPITAAARWTRHIRFAGMVNILPFRYPMLAAEEAAMLDNLTHGRLDMGLGRGLRPSEFEVFSVDRAQSREMFLESFKIIHRVLGREFCSPRQALGCAQGGAAVAAAGAAPAPAVSGQCAEPGIAALGGRARHPVRADRLGGRTGSPRPGALSPGSDGARPRAGATALSDARDLCRRQRCARRAEAQPHLLQYWESWNRYTQFTRGGRRRCCTR